MGLIKRKDNLTEDELKELLQRHLVEVQDIRNVRGQEKSKLDEKLREKLEQNKEVTRLQTFTVTVAIKVSTED